MTDDPTAVLLVNTLAPLPKRVYRMRVQIIATAGMRYNRWSATHSGESITGDASPIAKE